MLNVKEIQTIEHDIIVVGAGGYASGPVTAIAALMRPGSVLYLTTPDLGHWRRPRDIAVWDAFSPLSQCLYFSAGNLSCLLARHGVPVFRLRLAIKPGLKVLARKSGDAP